MYLIESIEIMGARQEMRTAVIHIGSAKAGSSALQQSFSENTIALNANGILYPKTTFNVTNRMDGKQIFEHNLLAGCYQGDDDISHLLIERYHGRKGLCSAAHNFMQITKEQFNEDNRYRTILLSGEFLMDASKECCREIKRWLFEELLVDDVNIVFYVRSPFDLYKSEMAQRVKTGAHLISPFNFNVNFKNKITIFEECFGRENLSVRLYDRESLVGNDIGVDFSYNFLNCLFKSEIVNESLPLVAMNFLYNYWNDTATKSRVGKQKFEILVPWLEGQSFKEFSWSRLECNAGIEAVVTKSNRDELRYLKDWSLQLNAGKFEDHLDLNFSDPPKFFEIFQNDLTGSQTDEFHRFVIDGLLLACFIMNENLSAKTHYED